MPTPDLSAVAKGNTCHGVNRAIITHLLATGRPLHSARILDLPCGHGALTAALQRFFPGVYVHGGDLSPPADAIPAAFTVIDASRPFAVGDGRPFDVICCVSGVMEFDNTLQFFATCRDHLAPDGLLVVTNDNLVTVRDRLAYLALGKTRQFELFGAPDRPTWKMIPLQNLLRIVHEAGFAVRTIEYIPVRTKDWWLLPLALALWPGQWLHTRLARSALPLPRRREMFPFRSLLSRHYLLYCEPLSPPPMPLAFRPATLADIPALEELIPLSARKLQACFYTTAQIESAIGTVFAVDRQLIRDGTYFVAVEDESARVVGCGGWSKRQTLYGGDAGKTSPDPLRDPATEPAMIRAFFIHPDFARRGIGRRIMELAEAAALAAGFRSIEIVATLPGETFYATFAYTVVERLDLALPNGATLPVVRMRKQPTPTACIHAAQAFSHR